MSLVHKAAKEHFLGSHRERDQPDMIRMQWQFFRLLFPSTATVTLRDVHLGKATSTVAATVSQNGQECMAGFLK
jgi:hypothetical protein